MVSDVEAQQMEQAMVETAGAGLKAQQMNLGQAAKAAAGGGPFMEQQFQKSQQDLAKQQAETAVKASGQQKLLEAQLQDTRRQMASQEIGQVQAVRDRRAQLAIEGTKAAVDVATTLLTGPASQLVGAAQRTQEAGANVAKGVEAAEAARQAATTAEKAQVAFKTAGTAAEALDAVAKASQSTPAAYKASLQRALQLEGLSQEDRANLQQQLDALEDLGA
jgi:hypothetical protein